MTRFNDPNWIEDEEEVFRLAELLIDVGDFYTARDLMPFLYKPWHWTSEYRLAQAVDFDTHEYIENMFMLNHDGLLANYWDYVYVQGNEAETFDLEDESNAD